MHRAHCPDSPGVRPFTERWPSTVRVAGATGATAAPGPRPPPRGGGASRKRRARPRGGGQPCARPAGGAAAAPDQARSRVRGWARPAKVKVKVSHGAAARGGPTPRDQGPLRPSRPPASGTCTPPCTGPHRLTELPAGAHRMRPAPRKCWNRRVEFPVIWSRRRLGGPHASGRHVGQAGPRALEERWPSPRTGRTLARRTPRRHHSPNSAAGPLAWMDLWMDRPGGSTPTPGRGRPGGRGSQAGGPMVRPRRERAREGSLLTGGRPEGRGPRGAPGASGGRAPCQDEGRSSQSAGAAPTRRSTCACERRTPPGAPPWLARGAGVRVQGAGARGGGVPELLGVWAWGRSPPNLTPTGVLSKSAHGRVSCLGSSLGSASRCPRDQCPRASVSLSVQWGRWRCPDTERHEEESCVQSARRTRLLQVRFYGNPSPPAPRPPAPQPPGPPAPQPRRGRSHLPAPPQVALGSPVTPAGGSTGRALSSL